MKKFKKIAISCLFALSLAGLAGCNPSQNSSDTGISQVVKVVGLDLAESASVDCGFTTQLTATVLPETATNKNVTWSSEDNNIATVDQTGLVTGVNNGVTKIKCVTEDGAITRECVVTVNGFRRSSSVFTNFGKIENNVTYNTKVEDGKKYKDYIVDTSNDEYMEFRFNRGETKEWASVLAWYTQLDTITSLDVEVELVSGYLPAIMIEFAGEPNYKQFKRISLTQGQTSKLHVNVTDYNMKTGDNTDGSWGYVFLELNNPNDSSDIYRTTDNNVVLRLRKLSMTEGEKELPAKINNFRYEESLKKLVFEKEVASTGYDLEVYSIEGETETKLDLDVRPTRFSVAGEKIPNIEYMFIPKNGEDFSTVPGSYRARIRAVNSVGEGKWSDDAYFTIEGQGTGEEITGYTSVNIADDGAINPNEHNQNNTYKTELTDNGYKVTFTSSDTASAPWESVIATFDKYAKYSELIVKFEVTNSAVPLNEVLIQFNDWGEGDAGTDGLIQSYNDISGKTGIIEIHVPITKDLSLGLGQIGLCFDRTPGAGDVEILVKHLELVPAGEPVESSYVHTGLLNNGAIVPNSSYNQGPNKDSYKSELVEEGYKLSFTGTASGEWDCWDSFVANYDPSLEYTSLTLKYKVLKSGNPINKMIIELGGDGSSKIQQWFTTSEGYNSETCIYTLQLTLPGSMAGFWGIISLQFDHNANLGETEVLVTELSMK